METQVKAAKPLHPLAWIAGIALVVFSAVGIGAFMGWIPNSMGGTEDRIVVEVPAVKAPARTHTASAPLAHAAPAPAAVRVAAVAAKCAECGVVESVREVTSKGEGTGLGAVGGAVVGGLLGNQVGGGRGQDVMTVVGAVGGAVAGNEVEKRVKSSKSYSITVRFDDGSSRDIASAAATSWRVGDKVKVINGAIQSNA